MYLESNNDQVFLLRNKSIDVFRVGYIIDSSTVLLAPGTFNNEEIALVPPPLETNVILYLDS